MASNWDAIREDREGGHVAKIGNRYLPEGGLPPKALARNPWMCVFHDEPGGPRSFVAFGGEQGMNAAIEAELGPLVPNVGGRAANHIPQTGKMVGKDHIDGVGKVIWQNHIEDSRGMVGQMELFA